MKAYISEVDKTIELISDKMRVLIWFDDEPGFCFGYRDNDIFDWSSGDFSDSQIDIIKSWLVQRNDANEID